MKRRLLVMLLLATACERGTPSVVKEAEFGVFFGGQVQELKEIPKELEPGRQQHGFRLTFRGPLAQDLSVAWELSLPATDKGGPRAALLGQATAVAGQRVLDVPLAFRATDPLGTWHAKLTAAGQLLVDRDFVVVAPASQKASPKSLAPRASAP